VDVKLPPDVWSVIADKLIELGFKPTDEVKQLIENTADIVLFDGGAFIANGNEIDLFVVPERRGKWRIRSETKSFIDTMKQKHGRIVARIQKENVTSLRLAKHFGFVEYGLEVCENGTFICLEQ